VLYAIGIAFPFIYALTRATGVTDQPRSLLQLCPVLAPLVGQAVSASRNFRLAAVVALAMALAVSGWSLAKTDAWFDSKPPDSAIAPRNIGPVIRMLDNAGGDRVYAQYWVDYRIEFETDERITAAESKLDSIRFADGRPVLPDNPVIRWRPYQTRVDASPRVGFVFINWPQDANRAKRLGVISALQHHGFIRRQYANLIVLLPPGHLPSPLLNDAQTMTSRT
jgi:hypothetical protein